MKNAYGICMKKYSIKYIVTLLSGSGLLLVLAACMPKPDVPMTLATNDWPGYRPFYLAQQNKYVDADDLHLVELTSTSEVLRSFRNGVIDAAALTLDEAMLLRQDGFEFNIVLVTDVSHGGDVIIAQKGLTTMQALKGKRIGVETTALGAYVLSRALELSGLTAKEVRIVPLEYSEHERAFLRRQVDAVVTFEPVRSVLLNSGGNDVFDSTQIPGEIVDVIIVRDDFLKQHPDKVRRILNAWFRALNQVDKNFDETVKTLAAIGNLSAAEYREALEGIKIPARNENKAYLDRENGRLVRIASNLKKVMLEKGLLKREFSITGMYTSEYLSGAGS
jgi:NitT/TauT family transport system substrate-binding protein